MACNNVDDQSRAGAENEAASSRLVEFDGETDSVTETVVATVADLAETSPTALEPLYDVVDPDALDAIIRSVATGSTPCDADITIRYHGYAVTIHSYGTIEVAPREDD